MFKFLSNKSKTSIGGVLALLGSALAQVAHPIVSAIGTTLIGIGALITGLSAPDKVT